MGVALVAGPALGSISEGCMRLPVCGSESTVPVGVSVGVAVKVGVTVGVSVIVGDGVIVGVNEGVTVGVAV